MSTLAGLLSRVDEFLLDRAFQPLIDWFGDRPGLRFRLAQVVIDIAVGLCIATAIETACRSNKLVEYGPIVAFQLLVDVMALVSSRRYIEAMKKLEQLGSHLGSRLRMRDLYRSSRAKSAISCFFVGSFVGVSFIAPVWAGDEPMIVVLMTLPAVALLGAYLLSCDDGRSKLQSLVPRRLAVTATEHRY